MPTKPDASDEAVKAKTGRDWTEWVKVIDAFGGADMTHKEIVQKLYEKGLGTSGWWRQMITVGYEKLKGRRALGETANIGFEIGVHKTIALPASVIWDFLLSPQGLKIWLGDIKSLKLGKKEPYQTGGGTVGEVRTWKEPEFIRLTWQPKGRKASTTLQVRTDGVGRSKTRMSFHHEKLADSSERDKMRRHWQAVVTEIAEAVG